MKDGLAPIFLQIRWYEGDTLGFGSVWLNFSDCPHEYAGIGVDQNSVFGGHSGI